MSIDEAPAPRSKAARQLVSIPAGWTTSGRADAFEQPAKQRGQNPMDIGEIRNQVYRDILGGLPSDGAFRATVIKLDFNGDLIEEAIDADKTKVLDVVQKSGVAKVFKLGLAQLPQHFTEFLTENASEMIFQFKHSESLDNFAELLRAYFTTPKGTQPASITVAISLFSDPKKFAKMAKWQDISMAHGYKEKAAEHVKEWMDAVQSLPFGVKLILHVNEPWLDYRSLRCVTACLRSGDAVLTTGVAVSKSAWKYIPDNDFHLKLTVASVQGGEVPFPRLPISEADLDELIKHGCRGFRGRV
jgi:hypothetical protein